MFWGILVPVSSNCAGKVISPLSMLVMKQVNMCITVTSETILRETK